MDAFIQRLPSEHPSSIIQGAKIHLNLFSSGTIYLMRSQPHRYAVILLSGQDPRAQDWDPPNGVLLS